MARRSGGRSALQRHLAVLDAFDPFHPFLSLAQLTRVTGMPASTLHGIVAELTREGLLERLPDRSYRLGMRLWEYASRTPGALGLREVARPWLGAAHARIRQHVQLGVIAGTDALFIDRLSARDAVINATVIGGRIPLHASSSGLVLLAHAGDVAVEAVVAAGMRAHTPHTITSEPRLRAELARVRAEGYAATEGHIHLDATGIAVPVRGPDGTVYAALGAVVPVGTATAPVVELLRTAGAGVARGLVAAYGPSGGAGGGPAFTDAGVAPHSRAYIAELSAREPTE